MQMENYLSLIEAMPFMEQMARSKKSTWVNQLNDNGEFVNTIVELFRSNDEVEISRAELFESSQSDSTDIFLAKAIVWGYPRGLRGNNFSDICDNIDSIRKLCEEAKKGINDWEANSNFIHSISGLGMSTYTKFLYFMKVDVNGIRSLILDKRVIDALEKCIFDELSGICHIRDSNALNNYLAYLKNIHSFSTKHDVEPDKVEMFLFQYGTSLKF